MRRTATAAGLLVALVGCRDAIVSSPRPRPTASPAVVVVRFDGAPPLRAEVARTAEQRRRGLMFRRSVPEGTGMVFVFPRPVTTGFWMKNTLVPLSIAYLRAGRVVSTAEMQPCRTADCPTYPPDGPFDAAVEAPGGFFQRYGVRRGTPVRIDGELGRPE